MEHQLYEREGVSSDARVADAYRANWRIALVTERIKQVCHGHDVSEHVIQHVARAAVLASLPMLDGFEDCVLAQMSKEKAKTMFRDAVRVGKKAQSLYAQDPRADWDEWIQSL